MWAAAAEGWGCNVDGYQAFQMELLLLGSSLAVLQPGRLRICDSRETSWDCSYWALEYACMLQFVAVYYACGASRSCCNSKASIVMQLGHNVGEGESCRVCCALHCTLYNVDRVYKAGTHALRVLFLLLAHPSHWSVTKVQPLPCWL